MKIAIVGSGNVATILGRLIVKSNHTVSQIISRNILHAKELAEELNASYNDFSIPVMDDADLVILAISDYGFENLFSSIIKNDKLIVHTAGAIPMEALQKYSKNYGVLYPLQTLRKEVDILPEIPFLIDGSSAEVLNIIEAFAKSISNDVQRSSNEDRIKLHAAAVIVSNFTNYLYSIAEDFCKKENVDFNLLKPLIKETAIRVQKHSPKDVQTGPAIRKDINTMDKHLRLLSQHPKLRTTYLRLTDSIMNP
ncbi:MAG: DUF2520 domain-containing protein [Bacteroidetes bacterium]|nr:DUF2520 domain-containing protein [Bacteroidota bacterium]MBS1755659.1 DUF2520 domain-containing protein [Bacteroidota bacterium]